MENPKQEGDIAKGIGFPFRGQLLGGYRKADVLSYIEKLASDVAQDRAELAEEKTRLYELLENGQKLCDDMAKQAEKESAQVIAKAQKTADEMILDAQRQVDALEEEQDRLRTRHREELEALRAKLCAQRKEMDEAYLRLVKPLETVLHSLEDKQNAH